VLDQQAHRPLRRADREPVPTGHRGARPPPQRAASREALSPGLCSAVGCTRRARMLCRTAWRQRACERGGAQIMDALIAEVGKDRLGVRLSPFGGASQARPRAAQSSCGAEPVRAWHAAVQAAGFACATVNVSSCVLAARAAPPDWMQTPPSASPVTCAPLCLHHARRCACAACAASAPCLESMVCAPLAGCEVR